MITVTLDHNGSKPTANAAVGRGRNFTAEGHSHGDALRKLAHLLVYSRIAEQPVTVHDADRIPVARHPSLHLLAGDRAGARYARPKRDNRRRPVQERR